MRSAHGMLEILLSTSVAPQRALLASLPSCQSPRHHVLCHGGAVSVAYKSESNLEPIDAIRVHDSVCGVLSGP